MWILDSSGTDMVVGGDFGLINVAQQSNVTRERI